MKIAISGTTGFVGSNLTELLSRLGHEIISINLRNNINLIDLEGVEVFIHLAGKAHDLKKTSDPNSYYIINTDLTKKVYDVFLNSNMKTFIFMSSVKAVRDSSNDIILESTVSVPVTHYGNSKLMAESYIQNTEKHNSKRYFILRPSLIYGKPLKGNLALLEKFVQKGLPWIFASFKNKRSYCSIHNIAFIINEIVSNSNIEEGIYNITDTDTISTNDLIKLISKEKSKNIAFIKIPVPIIKLIFKIGDLFSLPLNSEMLNKMTENYVVSNTKIRTAIKKDLPIRSQYGLKEAFK